MTQSHEATAWATIAVLLFTGCIGAGLAWIGRGYWLNARTTRDGVGATALIDRLAYTGPYLLGSFFAEVSFLDVAGQADGAPFPVRRPVEPLAGRPVTSDPLLPDRA